MVEMVAWVGDGLPWMKMKRVIEAWLAFPEQQAFHRVEGECLQRNGAGPASLECLVVPFEEGACTVGWHGRCRQGSCMLARDGFWQCDCWDLLL